MITYKNLSWPLKCGYLGGIVALIGYIVQFIIGFVDGVLYALS